MKEKLCNKPYVQPRYKWKYTYSTWCHKLPCGVCTEDLLHMGCSPQIHEFNCDECENKWVCLTCDKVEAYKRIVTEYEN